MGAEVLKLAQAGYRGMQAVAGVDAFAADELKKAGCLGGNVFADFDELWIAVAHTGAAGFAAAETGASAAETGTSAGEDTDVSGAIGSVTASSTMADSIECIVDFSNHAATKALTDFAVRAGKALVIATTGQTPEELEMIKEAAKTVPVFHAANFSLGVALLIELAKKTAAAMPDAEIEIIEKHHDRKLDAPSGTALAIANALKEVRPEAVFSLGRSGNAKRIREEIGIHAIRMGNIVGEHEVIIGTNNQTITLKHEAHSRALFAEGALAAAAFLERRPAGLYTMNDLIAE